ncbi:MAG TPA: hypothetical protein VGT44_22695 [Ktedonobacteraceae bacterium]|nr:hypothetical protein [Ktedonobacteraceae bacterium]
MDITALSTPTQMILAWVMISMLLGWFIVFAILAFHSNPDPNLDSQELWDEQLTPARSFPTVTVQVGQSNTLR